MNKYYKTANIFGTKVQSLCSLNPHPVQEEAKIAHLLYMCIQSVSQIQILELFLIFKMTRPV